MREMVKINVPVVGFVGKKESGKSTCARFLQDQFNVTIHPFAKRIKLMVKALGLSDAETYGQKWRNTALPRLSGATPRHILQTLGTEWAREMIHQDFWINLWKEDVKSILASHKGIVVVDDVRFENEAQVIMDMGGIVIRITRPSIKSNDLHQSETEQDNIKVDLEIVNDGDLRKLVDELMRHMSLGHTPDPGDQGDPGDPSNQNLIA